MGVRTQGGSPKADDQEAYTSRKEDEQSLGKKKNDEEGTPPCQKAGVLSPAKCLGVLERLNGGEDRSTCHVPSVLKTVS